MHTKTQVAFLMTAKRMFEIWPQVYFWTFTFVDVLYDEQAMYLWHCFIREVNDKLGNSVQGVRVVEVHPGGHGLHFHALLSRRLPMSWMRKVGRKWGMGVMWVERCDADTVMYLAKYLTKETQLRAGCRKWGTIGGYKSTTVKSLEVESVTTSNIRWLQEQHRVNLARYFGNAIRCAEELPGSCKLQLDYSTFLGVAWRSRMYGHVMDWPECRFRLKRSVDKRHFGKLNSLEIEYNKEDRPIKTFQERVVYSRELLEEMVLELREAMSGGPSAEGKRVLRGWRQSAYGMEPFYEWVPG